MSDIPTLDELLVSLQKMRSLPPGNEAQAVSYHMLVLLRDIRDSLREKK
jgi:hypothetical protein